MVRSGAEEPVDTWVLPGKALWSIQLWTTVFLCANQQFNPICQEPRDELSEFIEGIPRQGRDQLYHKNALLRHSKPLAREFNFARGQASPQVWVVDRCLVGL